MDGLDFLISERLNQCAGSSKKLMPYFMLAEEVPQVKQLSLTCLLREVMC